MSIPTTLKRLFAAAAGLLAASAAQAQDFDEPFFGGGYAPAPGYAYSGWGRGYDNRIRAGAYGVDAGAGYGPVAYDQGYVYGGYQYPAGFYGGGDYRRAAYSAADIYVGGYPPPYGRVQATPYPAYRPYAGRAYAPARGYYGVPHAHGAYYSAGYRPSRGLRQRCHCVLY